ncbi:MAG: hypothetical protein JW741_08475 [Sedimentisphaerales bacterium]|nr:hypothetical protein [Sedimentisphaerales bacterium]
MRESLLSPIPLLLVLSMVGASSAIVIGDFENGSMDGWERSWEGDSILETSHIGATSGSGSLSVSAPSNKFSWTILKNMDPAILGADRNSIITMDVTWIASEWAPQQGMWLKLDLLAVNSDGPSGWQQVGPDDSVNPDWPGSWDPSWGDQTRTLTYDLSDYDATGATWLQVVVSMNSGNVMTAGKYYIDNVEITGTSTPTVVAGPVGVISTASYNGHVYHLLEEADWYVSEAEAIRLGGHLVTVNDADENTWILNTFGQTARAHGGSGLWLGLNNAETETQWQWANDQPVTFLNWQLGEPDSILPSAASMVLSDSVSSGAVAGIWQGVPLQAIPNGDHSLGLVEIVVGSNSHPKTSIYTYDLPFPESDARGFFTHQDRLFILDYPERTLYGTEDMCLAKVEDMRGYYILDAAWFGGRPLYCSRNRVLYRQGGTVRVVPIEGTETLISIATDNTELYLLDASSNEIIVLTSDYDVVRRIPCSTRRPADIACHDGSLWLLDLSDRCIHKIEKDTGKILLKIQTGLRGNSMGLVFIGNELYVHDSETSSLRLVRWDKVGSAVLSCHHQVQYQFVQDSWNKSQTSTCTASFRVPVPPSLMHQSLRGLQWSEIPARFMTDQYNQTLAVFESIAIPPQGYHQLSYTAEVGLSAIQYQLPELPLESLEDIPHEIAMTYLANEDMYSLDAWNIRQAALTARNDLAGNPPRNAKELIENIVEFVLDRLSYVLDSGWDKADVVLDRGDGSCSEYSFLFSALCRLNGIPTRLVGGIGLKDMGVTDGWHRWTDIWYPTIGWVPVDVTKIDSSNPDSYDYEFLFGLPGYMMTFSAQGGNDPEGLGQDYFIWRYYQGGQRTRTNHVENLTALDPEEYPVVTLTLQ